MKGPSLRVCGVGGCWSCSWRSSTTASPLVPHTSSEAPSPLLSSVLVLSVGLQALNSELSDTVCQRQAKHQSEQTRTLCHCSQQQIQLQDKLVSKPKAMQRYRDTTRPAAACRYHSLQCCVSVEERTTPQLMTDRQTSFVWPPKPLGRRYLLQHLMPELNAQPGQKIYYQTCDETKIAIAFCQGFSLALEAR